MAWSIASSKLCSEVALNSVTRAKGINTPFLLFPDRHGDIGRSSTHEQYVLSFAKFLHLPSVREEGCLYSPSCRERTFSATQFPAYGVLGTSEKQQSMGALCFDQPTYEGLLVSRTLSPFR